MESGECKVSVTHQVRFFRQKSRFSPNGLFWIREFGLQAFLLLPRGSNAGLNCKDHVLI